MNDLSRTWGVWIVRGIASVVFGLLAVLSPSASRAALVLVFGVCALADGPMLLGVAFRREGRKAPYVVRGLLGIVTAIGLRNYQFSGPHHAT